MSSEFESHQHVFIYATGVKSVNNRTCLYEIILHVYVLELFVVIRPDVYESYMYLIKLELT